jgi:hypothetical protein
LSASGATGSWSGSGGLCSRKFRFFPFMREC